MNRVEELCMDDLFDLDQIEAVPALDVPDFIFTKAETIDTTLCTVSVTVANLKAYNGVFSYAQSPLGLWGEEIHHGSEAYGGTLQWTKDAGLTPWAAKVAAWADNTVDSVWRGTSFLPIVGDQSRHFNTDPIALSGSSADTRLIHSAEHLQNAIALGQSAARLSQGNFIQRLVAPIQEVRAMWQLGTGLHSLQDVDAHSDAYVHQVAGIYYHSPTGNADNPGQVGRPDPRYLHTQQTTITYVQTFICAITAHEQNQGAAVQPNK